MADGDRRRGIDNGPNSRPLDDTVAQTGPGIPDDAASEGYDPVGDAEAEHEAQRKTPWRRDLSQWPAAPSPSGKATDGPVSPQR